MTEKQDQMPPRTHTKYVTATYNRSINVKGDRDNGKCWITDCTLLSPDRMVIIDENNDSVKLIDISNNKVISNYNTSSEPNKVTAQSASIIAVTLPGESKIQLLDVNTAITLQREIKVNSACNGFAYKDGKFAVSYVQPGRVEILDIQGKVLHTIQPKQDQQYVLQQSTYITFGQDNDTVIVSDSKTHKVKVVTFRGQILRTYTHDILNQPLGIAITAEGVLFVCSRESGCIYVVSPDFKTSEIIIKRDSNVVYPASIIYCDINHKLYISNNIVMSDIGELNNNIQVYYLNV